MQINFKKFFLLVLLLGLILVNIKAQDKTKLYINTSKFRIMQGTGVYIRGSLEVDVKGNIDNGGNIILTDSLKNKAPNLFEPSSYGKLNNQTKKVDSVLNIGLVTFCSDSIQFIENKGGVIFDTIWVAANDSVILTDSINMVGQLEFNKGNFDLNGKGVLLYYKYDKTTRRYGTIGIERNDSRIVDSSGTGFIEAEKNLTDGGRDSFHTLGIDPNSKGGVTGIRRYHYHDSRVTDTSIAKVYELYRVTQGGGVVQSEFKYLDNADLLPGMEQDSLAVWGLQPNKHIEGFETWYAKDSVMYIMSEGNNSADAASDKVTGNTIFTEGYKFTLAEKNCDSLPPVNLGGDTSFCTGKLAKLKPFKDESLDWRDYFYQWGTSTDINRLASQQNNVFEYSFSTDSVPANADLKVWVNVRDLRGCHASDTINVRINSSSDMGLKIYGADMSPSLFNVCQGEQFYIKDTCNSDDTDNNYTWWFEKDTLADKNNTVFHALNVPGDTIKFGVKYVNKHGCVSYKPTFLTVHPLPEVSLEAEPPICSGTYAAINNLSTIPPKNPVSSITSYTWTIDTLDKIKVVYGSVTSEKGTDFHSKTLKETRNPHLDFRFTEAGWQNIKLEAMSNAKCVSSDSVKVYVNPSVTASFQADGQTNVCHGNPSLFAPDAQCSVVKKNAYSWLVNPNLPWIKNDTATHTYHSYGSYHVKLAIVSDSGCTDTVSKAVTVHPNAEAGFEADNNCLGTTTFVKNTSKKAGTYEWDFGNGTISNNFEHSVKYAPAGKYPVKLIADNQWGCKDSIIKEVEIYALPDIGFTARPDVCINQQQAYIENTSEKGLDYYWQFGDGSFSKENSPNKIYATPGSYIISLTGTDKHGCKSDSSLPVTIRGVIPAGFDPAQASVCEGAPSLFQPTNALVNLDSIKWIFGDGNENNQPATSPSVSHKYNGAGMYLASLVTTTGYGCKDTASTEVVISPNPQFNIVTEGQNCTASEIVFRVSKGTTVDDIAYYNWNFGDISQPANNVSDIPVPAHFYNNAGTYNVSLHAITHQGCNGYDTLPLEVNPVPEISFGDHTGTCDQSLELIAGPPSNAYKWHDGSTTNSIIVKQNGLNSVAVTNPVTGCSSYKETYVELSASVLPRLGNDLEACDYALLDAHNPGATYQWSTGEKTRIIEIKNTGTYSVTVTDINGCKGYDTINATINASPEITLPASLEFCEGASATIDPGVKDGTFNWNTGENTSTIEVGAPGQYWVEITGASGCSDQAMTNVAINPLPIISLGSNLQACEDVVMTLNAGNPGSTYAWNTGETTQAIKPGQSGWYTVAVTNGFGCAEKDSVQVTLHTMPVADLGVDKSVCKGDKVLLDAGAPGRYYWSTNETTPTITVSKAGDYWVRVTNSNNCTSISGPVSVTVREMPEKPFDGGRTEACKFALLDAQNPGSAYNWHNGNSQRNYYTETSGWVWVEITNAENCSVRDSVEVYVKPVADLDLPDGINICDNSHEFIDAGYFGEGYTYSWNTGSSEQFIKASAPGWYKVDVEHAEGCVVTDSTYVVSMPAPEIRLKKEIIMCSNSGLVLDAGNPGSLYSWGNSSGETYSGQVWDISSAGTYWVYVMAPNGCANSDTTEILQTSMSITPHFMVASNIRIGDTVRYVDLSVPDPVDYYWEFGDMITSTDKEPTHIYYVQDTFNATLTVSNEICSATISKPIHVEGYNPYYRIKMGMDKEQQELNRLIKILDVNIFPNPTVDDVTLKLLVSEPANVAYYMYSMNGQLVQSQRFDGIEELEHHVNLSGLSQGLYILRIVTRNQAKTFKILKQN